MISYAQNFEDVLLSRALQGVTRGFYIDVGAWHPTLDSVTRFFYDQGWSGVNVEPVEHYHRLLCQERPRDRNLQLVLGEHPGWTSLTEWDGTGLSAVGYNQPEHEAVLRGAGFKPRELRVEQRTLAQVTAEFPGVEVQFLKIDVEGAERAVLLGGDWKRCRPRIVLLEAVRPEVLGTPGHVQPKPAWDDWEGLMFENGYDFAFFDGLNRYYHRREEPQLGALLSYPACVLDQFRLAPGHPMVPRKNSRKAA